MSLTIEQRVRLGAATPQELEALGPERLVEIKSDTEHTQYRGCGFRAIAPPDTYAKDRKILRLVASTYDKDHYGDRISVTGKGGGKGWQLDDYKRQGGVYLWSHNMGGTKMPIGQAIKTWRGTVQRDGQNVPALLQDVEFLSADDGPDDHFKFAETVYLLMSGKGTRSGKGMMGSSVGFVPTKVYNPPSKEEREKLGLGPMGLEFHEQVLLENSATPTPANPFASVIGGGQKSFEANVLDELKWIEEQALLPASLVSDFRKRAILGPNDAEAKLAERLRSRVFVFTKDSPTTVPDGFDVVVHADEDAASDDAPATEPTLRDIVDASMTGANDGDGAATLTITAEILRAFERAYEAADLASATLAALMEAADKYTDPEITSSLGVGDQDLEARVASIESAQREILQILRGDSAKTTAPTPENANEVRVELDRLLDAIIPKKQ